jgi:hypothetical protein
MNLPGIKHRLLSATLILASLFLAFFYCPTAACRSRWPRWRPSWRWSSTR